MVWVTYNSNGSLLCSTASTANAAAGGIVILDNPPADKVIAARNTIEATAARGFPFSHKFPALP